jgi:hypothetical protein
MGKVASPAELINLDGVGDSPDRAETDGVFSPTESDINKKLDRLLELQERTGGDASLASKEFDLKYDVAHQNMTLQKVEFYFLLVVKFLLIVFVVLLVAGIAFRLHCLFGKTSIGDLMVFDKTHVLLAIVVGCFLTMFGLLAVLLKGLGQKEKVETPIAIEEILKAVLHAFKTNK